MYNEVSYMYNAAVRDELDDFEIEFDFANDGKTIDDCEVTLDVHGERKRFPNVKAAYKYIDTVEPKKYLFRYADSLKKLRSGETNGCWAIAKSGLKAMSIFDKAYRGVHSCSDFKAYDLDYEIDGVSETLR